MSAAPPPRGRPAVPSPRSARIQRHDWFDIIDGEATAYWLGYVFARGHLSSDGRYVRVIGAPEDRQHLHELAEHLGYAPTDRDSVAPGEDPPALYLWSAQVWAALRRAGCHVRKTRRADEFTILSSVAPALQSHLVRGLVTGKGSFSRAGIDRPRLAVYGSHGLIERLRALLAARGVLSGNLLEDRSAPEDYGAGIMWSGARSIGLLGEWLLRDATVVAPWLTDWFAAVPPAKRDKSSQFRGVLWNPRSSAWEARIVVDGRLIRLGLFDDGADAARAYDIACVQHGRRAVNFPNDMR